jgi:hypothetical protein
MWWEHREINQQHMSSTMEGLADRRRRTLALQCTLPRPGSLLILRKYASSRPSVARAASDGSAQYQPRQSGLERPGKVDDGGMHEDMMKAVGGCKIDPRRGRAAAALLGAGDERAGVEQGGEEPFRLAAPRSPPHFVWLGPARSKR